MSELSQTVQEQTAGWQPRRRLGALVLTGVMAMGTMAARQQLSGDVARAQTGPAPVTSNELDNYLIEADQAWVPYTADDGHVVDPYNPTNTGDGYGVGVVMLADTMLQTASRDGDQSLVQAAERIIGATSSRDTVSGPFNLLAIDTLLRHGQAGDFSQQVWSQIAGPVTTLAARTESTVTDGCLTDAQCYSNWRLVWSAGAGALLASGVPGAPGSGNENPTTIADQINTNLNMAVSHAGAPARTSIAGGKARELSDPLSEPPSYHVFSSALLELIAEQDPATMTPAVQRLRSQTDRYALEMMAPDGQLSFAGRSLDQSWVQAAAADLGARRALADPTHAAEWRSFADRAFSYLLANYPKRADGIVPIVPGLAGGWNPDIMDGYAYQPQYAGLTLWLLNDALNHWPDANAPRGLIPADHPGMFVNDLRSSGLAWGRSDNVWWELAGRRTSADPRFNQGVVDVKVKTAEGWQDLLALRPIQTDLSSAWAIQMPGDKIATPLFSKLRGNGNHATFTGRYREAAGKVSALVTWTLKTTGHGIKLDMTKPPRASMHTTLWQPNQADPLSARAATAEAQPCIVTASGQACPTTLRWTRGNNARIEIGN